jgi:D-alanyl-D-alanine carboxypeptidase
VAAPLGRTAGGLWAIQVGAFSRFEPADQAAAEASRKVPQLLKSAHIQVEQASKGSKKIYRAQLRGLTQERARAACEALRASKTACLVIRPGVDLVLVTG